MPELKTFKPVTNKFAVIEKEMTRNMKCEEFVQNVHLKNTTYKEIQIDLFFSNDFNNRIYPIIKHIDFEHYKISNCNISWKARRIILILNYRNNV